MPDNVIDIGFKIDRSELNALANDLQTIKTQADALPESFDDVKTSASNMLSYFNDETSGDNSALFSQLPQQMSQTFQALFDSTRSNMESLNSMLNSKDMSSDMTTALRQSLGFQNANIRTLMSSARQIGEVYNGIADNVKDSFGSALGDMVRDASRLLRATPAMIHGGTSTQGDFGYVKQLQQNVPFAKGAAAMSKAYGLSDDQMQTLLSGVVQHAVPYYQRADYWRQAESGSNRQLKYGFNADERLTDFRKRLPARYHALPRDPKQITVDESDLLKGQLTSKEYNLVKMVAAQNPSFEEALIATGHATRGRIVEEIDGEQIPKKAGVLHMPSRPISRQAYAEALGYMYSKMLLPALEGAPAYLSDLSSSDAHTQMTQAAKSSRVPHEVYQAAQKLDAINISPVFRNWEQPASYAVNKDASIAISTDAPPIRPDRFQIFSLTRSDFSKGVKLDKSAGYVPVNADDVRRQHPSINKVYERSLYTDMLGLYGNNTYGNGSKTEAGMPKMLLIDTHDEILATDENGRLIFEDGQAKGNTKALEEIRDQIFKPNRELSYIYNGQEHKYRYAARQYGDTDRTDNFYVPTNIKGSNIFMAREDAWAEMAKRSLEKYGVNIYDNFVDQNMLYETEQPIGKGVEARNRLLTPSVPFPEVGGRMPDKNKVAFVAMESFAGLDGAMLFMPGYVPGGDATIRAPGIKGMGQSVDFKKIIRDLYGEDTKEFKVPFIDAPKEIQERFKANGLSGFSQEEIDQHFIDIMKYDALVTDSVVKSDFQIKHRLNAAGSDVPLLASERNRERQDLFYSVLDDVGGMRVVKTAKDFWTDKQAALSGQMSQNLELTPEDIRENNRLWNEHIDALLYNPVKTIEMLFADPDDPLSQRVRANPALLQSDPEAISRIRDALQSAQISRAQNEQYARNDAAMGVALPNPAEWIIAAGRRNGLTISNEQQANDLTLHSNDDADEIAVPQWKQTTAIGGGRYPNNQLETFNLINSSAYSKAMQQYGLNPYAVYMNAKTIAKMGGGDFDGDTVQLVRNKLQEYVQQTIKQRREMLPTTQDPDAMREALKSAAIKFDEPRMSNEGDLANNQLRGALSILKMSSVSTTSDSLSQGDWHSKSWVDTIGKSAFALKAIYDIDSTYAKTGIFAEWDKTAKDARKLMGKPFSHIYKNLAGAIENNDFSLLGDLSQVNFPSIYSGLTVGNLSAMQATPLSDAMVESLIQNQDARQGISNMLNSNNPALVARGQYLQFNNQLMSKLLTGRASAVSNQDMDTLQSLWNTWYKAAIPDRDTLSDSDSDSEELREQKYALRKQQARLKFARQFGVTEDRILNKDGYAGAGFYQDVRYTDDHSIFEVAANAEQDRLRAQAALMVGHNPQIVSATQAAGISQIAGQGIAKANDLKYSFTMLSQLNGDRGDMKEWYEKYILGNWPKEGKNQFEKDVGDAAHKSLEAYAKERIANDAFNADRFVDESGVEKSFEDVFYDTLKGSPSFRDKEFDINKLTESERKRVKSAAMFARRLNTQFANREFIASEQEIQLPLGYQRHTSGVGLQDKPLNTIGKIDILTRMKNPDGTNNPDNPVIETDLKAHAEKDAFPQLLFYSSGLDKKPGIQETVGYLDESIQKEGRLTSHSMPYNAANANKVLDTAMAKVDAVFQLAKLTGLPNSHIPTDAMSTQFADFMPGNTAAAYRAMRDAAFDIPHKGSAVDSHEDARPPQETYLSPEALAQIAASRKLIDSNTGRGIARAMSVEQEIYEFANEMTELAGKFTGKIKRTETGARNPWETYRYLFSEGGIDKRIQLMGEKGASEDDKKRMEIFKADAEAKYAEALRKSAVKDLSDFNENVVSDMSSSKADRGIVNYIKQQDELEDAFTRAAQAKKVFEEEMEAKKKAGKQLTEDEQKALEEAEEEYRYAKLHKQMQADTIKSRALDSANLSLFEFEAAASGRQLSAQQLAKKDAFQMRQRLESQIGNVDVQLQKGWITDEQADKLYERIRSTNVDEFEHTRLEHYQAEDARRAAASNKRVERLRTQGRRLDRNIWGRHNNDLLSRSIREWESGQDQYDNVIASLENEIAHEKQTMEKDPPGSESYKKASENLKKLEGQLRSTQAKAEAFKGAMGAVSTALGNVGDTIGRVASQFGRQMFHNAMQEAKRFVQEFDASMTEIQMITGKTDAEMSQLGSDLIQTAIDMKVGVSDVTNAAADLYRQGLEDEDVEVRMEDVQKFAKVAKIKSSEASKIITTALSNDLVESSGEAMDALVALGDSAATTASEIAKGMQKSAASAKQAGVSYEQLVTMLTIITSKTQLGGNQAGTALQTLMYRLYRVNEGDDFYDENGNRIAANQAAKALSQLGVSIYDDNGNARGAFDIMVDVAKNWDSADSISQEMVLNALGAGRQRSNIATLIQGLAEDEGALMEKYMSLASGSEGVTDEKYLAYLNSLQASLDAVKSSFDQLIASFAVSDTASGVLNFIAEFIQGLAAAEEASGKVSEAILHIIAVQGTLALASSVIRLVMGDLTALTGLAIGIGAIGTIGVAGAIGSYGKSKNESREKLNTANSHINDAVDDQEYYKNLIVESEKIISKEVLSDVDISVLQGNLDELCNNFGLASIQVENTANSLKTAAGLINQANALIDAEYKERYLSQAQTIKDEADTRIAKTHITSEGMQQRIYGIMGDTNVFDSQYNSANQNYDNVFRNVEWISGREDLSKSESSLINAFDEYISKDVSLLSLSNKERSEYLNSRAQDYLMEHVLDASDVFNGTLLEGKSIAKIMDVLTSSHMNEFVKTDSADYFASLGWTEPTIRKARSQGVAALWRYFDTVLKSDQIDIEQDSRDNMDQIIEDFVPMLLPDTISEADQSQIIEQFKRNIYSTNISAMGDETVSREFGKEVDNLVDMIISSPSNIVESYVEKKYRPIWQYTDAFGEVHSGQTYDEAFNAVAPRVYGSSGIDAQYTNDAIKNANILLENQAEGGVLYKSTSSKLPALDYSNGAAAPSDRNAWINYFIPNTPAVRSLIDDTVANQIKQGNVSRVFDSDPSIGKFVYNIGNRKYMTEKELFDYFVSMDDDLRSAYDAVWYDPNTRLQAESLLNANVNSGMLKEVYRIGTNDYESFSDVVKYAAGFLDPSDYVQMPQLMAVDENGNIIPPEKDTNEFEDALSTALNMYLSNENVSKQNRANALFSFALGSSHNIPKGTKFSHLISSQFNSESMPDLKQTFSDMPELAEIIDRYTLTTTDAKGNVLARYAIKEQDDIAYKEFMDALAPYTSEYQNALSYSRIDNAQYAKLAFDNVLSGINPNDIDLSLIETVAGESFAGKLERIGALMYSTNLDSSWLDGESFKLDQDGNLVSDDSGVLAWWKSSDRGTSTSYSDYLTWAKKQNANKANTQLTTEDRNLWDILVNNAQYGIDGLTPYQMLGGIQSLDKWIADGKLSTMIDTNQSWFDVYGSSMPSFVSYVTAAQQVEGIDGDYTINDVQSLSKDSENYVEIDNALKEHGSSIEDVTKAAEDFNDELAKIEKVYGDLTGEVLANSKAWKGNSREVASARKQLNSAMSEVSSNQWARSEFKKGSKDKDVIDRIAAMTGFSAEDVETYREDILKQLDLFEESDLESMKTLASGLDDRLTESINKSLAEGGDLEVAIPGITAGSVGTVDFSEAAAQLSGLVDADLLAIASDLASKGFEGHIAITDTGDGVKAQMVITGLGTGRKSGGGGGGGGGKKSATEKLLEEQEREVKLREHKIKMIQYEETRYANANELSNEAIMIGHEIKEEERLIELKKEHLNELKKQLAATKKYSEEWYACAEAILTTEEAIAELNNTIDENKQKIEDLEQQVLKLHTDLESAVKEEIETRIQAERNMLDGTVSMQDIILEAIRERYRKEWELMQEDIDKKRKALEEEIAMIDERLQRRKDAEDEASKYEELAELERQLALVSMDSTRTKDQRELRERIEELQNELAWDAAEDEAQFQKDTLQDEIDAYTQYEEDYQEYLDDLLEDANNFSVEVNEVLQMSQEDLLQWLSDNVEEFRLSLEASQEQLTQSWTDTFKQMKGIVDTFWDEIIATLSSKESFMEYMKQSQAYQYASDDEKAQMEYTWGNMYDDWISAKKESDEAKNYDHKDAGDESSGKVANNTVIYNSYYGGLDSSGKWVTGGPYASADAARAAANRKELSNIKISSGGVPSSPVFKLVSSDGSVLDPTEYKNKGDAQRAKGSKIQQWGSSGNIAEINKWQSATIEAFSSGGYVDYTGLAMVHGTASRPEAFLSAEDTALVRAMLDSWQFVFNRPVINNVDSALNKNGSGVSFGDLTIEINEASLADDADIEEVARRVGEAFTKELSQSGLRTVSYNF